MTGSDAAGNVGSKGTLKVTTLPATDTIAPSKPASVSAKLTAGGSAALKWSASKDAFGVTGYTITITLWKTKTAAASSLPPISVDGTTLTYALTNLTVGQPYKVAVQATDAAGNISTPASYGFTAK